MTDEWPTYPVPSPTRSFSADPLLAPALRASNADRAHAVAVLDGAYAEGRLSVDEHASRKAAAEAAVTLGDLGPLVADVDLPTVAEPTSSRLPLPYEAPDPVRPEPALSLAGDRPEQRRPRRKGWLGLPRWWFQMSATLLLIWFITGVGGNGWSSFWPVWPILGTAIYYLMSNARGRD